MLIGCTLFIAALSPANASLSGPATPGDNCTPFNPYKIGYRTAHGARIAQQSVILEDGWQLVGWVVQDQSGAAFFVPYESYFAHVPEPNASGFVPILFAIGHQRVDFSRGFDAYVQWLKDGGFATDPNLRLPTNVLVVDCFTKALP